MFIEAGRIYFTCLFHHCCMAECKSFFQHIVRLPSHLTVTLRNFLHLYHVLLYLYLYCPKDICHNGLHTSRFSSSRGCRMVSLLEFHYKHIFSNRCIFYYYSFSSDEFLTKFRASSNPSFVPCSHSPFGEDLENSKTFIQQNEYVTFYERKKLFWDVLTASK